MMGKGIVSIALAHSAQSRPCRKSRQSCHRDKGAIASTLCRIDTCICYISRRNHANAAGIGELGCVSSFPLPVIQGLAKWLSALAVALMVHSGTPGSALAYELASATEDKILGIIRTIEAKTETALTTVTHVGDREGDVKTQRDLVDEVYDVVLRNFDDSRRSGYTEDEWKGIRDDIIAREISDPSVAHSAIREMVLRLKDPYSRFLSPSEFSSMSKYDISGVGLNLGSKQDLEEKTGLHPEYSATGGAWVVGLIRDSAADDAGMQQGDLILSIDGESLEHKSPFEVASLFQAPPEEDFKGIESEWFGITKVSSDTVAPLNVQVKRVNGDVINLTLKRPHAIPTPSPVTSKYESKKKRGYIKLSSFNARAQRDVSMAVAELQAQGVTSLVLDLRGNRGGLVSEGIEVAKIFLSNEDVIVRSKIKARKTENFIKATNEKPLTDASLIVLVDGGTASASEIVAGALQDNCRAPLIGQRTYGKGLIQSVYELSDGSGLVLTVGSYLTPSGINIDWEGLKPDFSSEPPAKEIDAVLRACKVRNGRL